VPPGSKLARNRRLRFLETTLRNTTFFASSEVQVNDPELYLQFQLGDRRKEHIEFEQKGLVDRILWGAAREESGHTVQELQKSKDEQLQEFDSDSDDAVSASDVSEHPKEPDAEQDMFIQLTQRFIAGHHETYLHSIGTSYRSIDDDTQLDNAQERERDEEEEYFDSDDGLQNRHRSSWKELVAKREQLETERTDENDYDY